MTRPPATHCSAGCGRELNKQTRASAGNKCVFCKRAYQQEYYKSHKACLSEYHRKRARQERTAVKKRYGEVDTFKVEKYPPKTHLNIADIQKLTDDKLIRALNQITDGSMGYAGLKVSL